MFTHSVTLLYTVLFNLHLWFACMCFPGLCKSFIHRYFQLLYYIIRSILLELLLAFAHLLCLIFLHNIYRCHWLLLSYYEHFVLNNIKTKLGVSFSLGWHNFTVIMSNISIREKIVRPKKKTHNEWLREKKCWINIWGERECRIKQKEAYQKRKAQKKKKNCLPFLW